MSDDELVRRYLLGDLPGDEQEALEKRLLVEDDLFELAEAVEAEVLEDYDRDELTDAQRQRVERYLAVSREGALRLGLLRQLSGRSAVLTAPSGGKLLDFPRTLPHLERWMVQTALAAMLVLTAGSAWLVSRYSVPPPREWVHKMQPPSDLPITPTPTPPPASGDRLAAKPTPTPRPTPAPAPPPSSVVFVATIVLSSLRAGVEIPTFDVAAETDIVELRLTLPPGDAGYPSYQVSLEDSAGTEVTSKRLRASGTTLTFRVDAAHLPAGRYSLKVQGNTPEGAPEDLAFPEFEVREPQPL